METITVHNLLCKLYNGTKFRVLGFFFRTQYYDFQILGIFREHKNIKLSSRTIKLHIVKF